LKNSFPLCTSKIYPTISQAGVSLPPIECGAQVRCWHKADMRVPSMNVRCREGRADIEQSMLEVGF